MGVKIEDFDVVDTIGRGSHGTIRKVKRKTDGQLLVWKELHYASMSEAEKLGLVLEVNLLRELHHPNIVRFYNHLVDRRTGTLFIIMEYCPGGDLRHLVNKCSKTGSFLEEGFIWRVLKQVCEALRVCHEKQTPEGVIILHRDIKPANVFLDKDGNIKLGDFGLARTLNSNASFARTFVGTPYYMSPEVINGREYNERSDIWSLGCLIYELCALEPPFKASNQSELYEKIKLGRFKRIPVHYSNGLWEIIQEMLTEEDYLRPSAFMILHDSALSSNTTGCVKQVEDSCSDSLSLSLSLSPPAKTKSIHDTSDEGESSYLSSLAGTVKERVISEEEKKMEESLMREVEAMLKESQLRKEKERQERLEGTSELSVDLLELPVEQEISLRKSKVERKEPDKRSSLSLLLSEKVERKVAAPPTCVCGGTTLEDWKERVSLVRASELAVKKREMAVEERERELAKREHRLHTMEQEVKQHLVRAQIYLKQCRTKGHAPPLPLKLMYQKDASDFDATTVSADIGYDDRPTVAFLDYQNENNPFLKMRESIHKQNNTLLKNTNLSRSNTLDNPKSRRKHGNYFYLERDPEKTKIKDEGKEIPLETFSANNSKKSTAIPNDSDVKHNLKLRTVQDTAENNVNSNEIKSNNKQKEFKALSSKFGPRNNVDQKGKSGNILTTLRQNFARNNLTRKSAKSSNLDKENRVERNEKGTVIPGIKRKPLGAVNTKRFHSKGVCAKPEKEFNAVQPKSQFSQNISTQSNIQPQGHTFRFYNAV